MDGNWARDRFMTERVARLATADDHGRPHLVPIVFALRADVIYSAIDNKPKSSDRLRRLDNITRNPRVCALVDRYDEQWTALWWARADGDARIMSTEDEEANAALSALTIRYDQYRLRPPPGPVIAIDVTHWSGWTGA
jgi:PPOX class probable F420-dependent enzyme